MKKSGAAFIAVMLLAGPLAFANPADSDQGQNEQEHLQQMKQQVLKDLDAQMTALQKFRDCVNAAADFPSMKKCHDDREAAMKAFMQVKKQERLQRIKEQQQQLEKEKQQLEQQETKP